MLNDQNAKRLGDPPNAGYSTMRQREASDWMNDIIRTFERDRLTLLVIVVSGRDEWRKIARKQMRGMLKGPHLDEVVDEVFRYFRRLAGPAPFDELMRQMEALAELKRTPHHKKALWVQR